MAGKRKKKGPRTKSGRLSRAYKSPELRDLGTPQVQARRTALVGENADPALSSTMPGVLLARGYIDQNQYVQAIEFRQLRCALYGAPWPVNTAGNDISDERLQKLKARFDHRVALLTQIQKLVINEVCVFDEEPCWLRRCRNGLPMRVIDEFERRVLIDGLSALANGQPARGKKSGQAV